MGIPIYLLWRGVQVSLWDSGPVLTCAKDETKLWLSWSAKQRRNPCSGPLKMPLSISQSR